MSLLTTSSKGQTPYDYIAKFPSGCVKVPRNGEIGLLNATLQKWNAIPVDESNDTFLLSWGRSNLILHSQTANSFENQADWLPPRLIKLTHGLYNPLLPVQNNSSTATNPNFAGAMSLIAELQDRINDEIKQFGFIVEGSIQNAGGVDFLEMVAFTRQNAPATNLLVELEHFNLINNSGTATITQSTGAPNVGAVVRPTDSSTAFISKYNMAFGAFLDDLANDQYNFKLSWTIPIGASTERFNRFKGGSFYGLCLESQVDTNKFRDYNLPILEDNVDGSVEPNMPIVIRFGPQNDPQVFVDIYNIDQNSNGQNVLGAKKFTLTDANAIMVASVGAPRTTEITFSGAYINKEFRLAVTFKQNDGPGTTTTLSLDGAGVQPYAVLDAQFFQERVRWVGRQPKNNADPDNIDFTLTGKDIQVGMSAGKDAGRNICADNTPTDRTIISGLLHFGALQSNQVLDLGLDSVAGNNPVFAIPDPTYLAMTKQCNMNFMLTLQDESNVFGGTTYKYMIGRDSTSANGAFQMGTPFTDDLYAINNYKVNINNVGLSSFRGDNNNGAVDRCVYAGFADYANLNTAENSGIMRIEPPEVMMVKLGNKEELSLNYLRFTITNFDNELSKELQGTTYINLVVKEGKKMIPQRSNVVKLDVTEKMVEYERNPF